MINAKDIRGKVLITGATGSIGANAVKGLVERGYTVRAQLRPGTKWAHKIERFDIERCYVDLRDREGLRSLVAGMDYVIHLGMYSLGTGDTESYNLNFLDVNTGSTLALLEATRVVNPGLKRFVYASSGVVYPLSGIRYELLRTSEISRHPSNLYAVSKLTGEYLTNIYHRDYGIPTVILRLPMTFCGRELLGERSLLVSPFIEDRIAALESFVPPSEAGEECLCRLRSAAQEGKVFLIPLAPDGTPWRQHIGDVRDVVKALALALHADQAVGKTVDVVSAALDYERGIPHLAKITGFNYVRIPSPFGDYYWHDITDTFRLLGYCPDYDSGRVLEDAWRHLHGEDIGIVDGTAYSKISRKLPR